MKQQAKKVSPWKLGVLTVLCASLFTVFACTEEKKDGTRPDYHSDESQMKKDGLSPVEEQPEFEGGIGAFYRHVANEMNYPLQARQMGIEGRVDVQFIVEKDGSLSDVKVAKGIGAGCDSEAVRIVQNAPSFKPGTQRGKPVRVRMVMPIIFRLSKGETNEDSSTKGIISVEEVEQKKGKLKVDANYANGEWSGTVYDEDGEGLPGANIMVKGSTAGIASDTDGTFKVKADHSKDLYISFVGYESVRLKSKR